MSYYTKKEERGKVLHHSDIERRTICLCIKPNHVREINGSSTCLKCGKRPRALRY